PQLTGLGTKSQAVGIPMTVGVDFGPGASLVHKRVVARHGAVVSQPKDLPDVVAEILSPLSYRWIVAENTSVSVAHRQIEHAVRPEDKAAAVGPATGAR